MHKSCEKKYVKKKSKKLEFSVTLVYMSSQLYALLYSLAHSAVSLRCEDLHEQAMHLTVVTCHSRVSKIVGQLRLKMLSL